MWTRLGLLAMISMGVVADAEACGGFFCDQAAPRDTSLFDTSVPRVDQTSERIVFAVDKDAGKVEVHVQVSYEGSVDEFAWIVPVAAEPELFVSTEDLFAALDVPTTPRFQLLQEDEGTCKQREDTYTTDSGWGNGAGGTNDSDAFEADTGGEPGVTVVARQEVGPYQTVTLQAETTEGLINWLQGNGFTIPADAGKAMAPYLADGAYFVALRLGKDKDAGDIVPFGMRYVGTQPQIPLVLTRIAAVEDMRLLVWVLGEGRAVPDNYLHVVPNLTAVNWWTGGDNWRELIARAADEAGGQAFATDYAGVMPSTNGLWQSFWVDEATLRGAATAYDWLVAFRSMTVANLPEALGVLETVLPWQSIAPDAGPLGLYNCPSCYEAELLAFVFDSGAATDVLDRDLVTPRRSAAALMNRTPWVTRLTSSMSPSEMEIDPSFVINPDMKRVDALRSATMVALCREDLFREQVPRELRIDGGPTVPMPSEDWMEAQGWDYDHVVDQLDGIRARRIEDTLPLGEPQPIALNDGAIEEMIAAFADQFADASSGLPEGGTPQVAACGCDQSGPSGAAGLLLLGGLLGLRRRGTRD